MRTTHALARPEVRPIPACAVSGVQQDLTIIYVWVRVRCVVCRKMAQPVSSAALTLALMALLGALAALIWQGVTTTTTSTKQPSDSVAPAQADCFALGEACGENGLLSGQCCNATCLPVTLTAGDSFNPNQVWTCQPPTKLISFLQGAAGDHGDVQFNQLGKFGGTQNLRIRNNGSVHMTGDGATVPSSFEGSGNVNVVSDKATNLKGKIISLDGVTGVGLNAGAGVQSSGISLNPTSITHATTGNFNVNSASIDHFASASASTTANDIVQTAVASATMTADQITSQATGLHAMTADQITSQATGLHAVTANQFTSTVAGAHNNNADTYTVNAAVSASTNAADIALTATNLAAVDAANITQTATGIASVDAANITQTATGTASVNANAITHTATGAANVTAGSTFNTVVGTAFTSATRIFDTADDINVTANQVLRIQSGLVPVQTPAINGSIIMNGTTFSTQVTGTTNMQSGRILLNASSDLSSRISLTSPLITATTDQMIINDQHVFRARDFQLGFGETGDPYSNSTLALPDWTFRATRVDQPVKFRSMSFLSQPLVPYTDFPTQTDLLALSPTNQVLALIQHFSKLGLVNPI